MKANRALFYGWSALVTALLALAAGHLVRGIHLDTNILNLLPPAVRDPAVMAAIQRHNDSFSRSVAFLAGATTESASQAAALELGRLLRESGLFTEVSDRPDKSQGGDLYRFYLPYRASLLSATDRELLAAGKFDELANNVLAAMASPAPGFSAGMLAQDPLSFHMRFLSGLMPQTGRLRLQDGMLTSHYEDRYHTLVNANIAGDVFAPAYQQKFREFYQGLASTLRAQFPGSTLVSIGMIHNASAGTERAKSEISLISAVSMVGLVLLFAFGFRSLGPLFYGLIPMAAGIVAAFVACITVFGSIHIMTLVFGTSLIGVCMDYALHFFTDRAYRRPTPSPRQCLDHILPGMTLGMISSVIGYTAFYTTSFPGLRQMALFSSTGLITAYCCVVYCFPRLPALRTAGTDHFSAGLAGKILAFWDCENKYRVAILAILALLAACGIMLADVNDDIRLLDNSPPRLHEERQKFQDITGINPGGRFFVVSGGSPESVLEREQVLTDILQRQVTQGDLAGFRATSNHVPSAGRQRENYRLVRDNLENLHAVMERIGYQPEIIAGYRRLYSDPEPPILDSAHWGQTGHARDVQWLEPEPGKYASLVYLLGAGGMESVIAAARNIEGVHFVDQAGSISEALRKYRELTNKMILAAYVLVFLVLIWRFGPGRAVTVLTPPVLAAAGAFALCGFTGEPLTLFNSLAILLVLGLGIDYTIFLAENGDSRRITMIGILYSSITTVLAFGLLAFSGTPALKSIGLTVFYGITATLLLAPVAKSANNSRQKNNVPGPADGK